MNFKEYLREAKDNTFVVVYAGRFQPFHANHYETYQNLVKVFGKDNVYIGTSNKVDPPKSPFNFKEKKSIITTMFPIPKNKVVQVKNPYKPSEITDKYPEDAALISAVGLKDSERLSPKYFTKYPGSTDDLESKEETVYTYVTPKNTNFFKGDAFSGTLVRELIGGDDPTEILDALYPKKNKKIYELLIQKIGGE